VFCVQRRKRLLGWLAGVQSAYFVATGVWPLVHLRSFLAVTGPKYDLWLVKTVGLLVGIIGVAVGIAAWCRRYTPETVTLAAGSAALLAGVDVYYHARGTIPAVYLIDAAAEVVLVVLWIVLWRPDRS
jgi:hypothetical protein